MGGKARQIASGTGFIMDPANHRVSGVTTCSFDVFGGIWTKNASAYGAASPEGAT